MSALTPEKRAEWYRDAERILQDESASIREYGAAVCLRDTLTALVAAERLLRECRETLVEVISQARVGTALPAEVDDTLEALDVHFGRSDALDGRR